MEYGALLYLILTKKLLQNLDKIQYRATHGALGYRSSTPTNITLAEVKEIPVFHRFKQLGRTYVPRCYTRNHPMVQFPEEFSVLIDNPGRGESEKPVISEHYKEATPLGHTIK
jgi:hypothetical protein